MSEEELIQNRYMLQDPAKDVQLLGPQTFERYPNAIKNYCEKKLFGEVYTPC